MCAAQRPNDLSNLMRGWQYIISPVLCGPKMQPVRVEGQADLLHTVSVMRPMHALRHPDGCHLLDALALQTTCLPYMLATLVVYIIPHEMNISTF